MANRPPLLTRKQLAQALREEGIPIGDSTLVKLSCPAIGQGPPISAYWGNRPLYTLADGIAWAKARLRRVRPAADSEVNTAA
jgi:hypothetical protein